MNWAQWYMPAHTRQDVDCLLGLHGKFQVSQGFIMRPCLTSAASGEEHTTPISLNTHEAVHSKPGLRNRNLFLKMGGEGDLLINPYSFSE